MKHLFIYFKGYLKETILGPLFKFLEASLELLVPLVIARMVDSYIPHNDKNHLYLMIFFLVLLAFSNIIVAIIAQFYSAKAAVGYTKQLSRSLFEKIMRLPKESRDELTTSSLVTRLVSDTFQIQTGINQFLRLFESPHHCFWLCLDGLFNKSENYHLVFPHGFCAFCLGLSDVCCSKPAL